MNEPPCLSSNPWPTPGNPEQGMVLLHGHQPRFWSTSPSMTSSLTSTPTGRYNFPPPAWYPGSCSPTGDRKVCAWPIRITPTICR